LIATALTGQAVRHPQGNFKFVFSVMLSTNFQVLEKALVLFEIARGPVEQKAGRIAAIVKEHEASISFNPTWLEGNEKVVMEALASRVTPLVSHPGRIVVTSRCVYFQPFNVVSSAPVLRFPLKAVVNVMRRVRGLEPTGLELFFSEADATDSLYVTFKSEAIRNKFYEMVLQQPHLTWTPKTPNRMLREWQSGRLSNYQYLMWLNMQSDRSFNDLTQYPVFPWVLTDFTSETLNLKDKNVFRDLSKPVGALNPKRLAACRQRYFDMEEANEELEDDNPMKTPPFLYGCHYSTPGFVVYYLLRKAPQLMLRLQNGRFDMADRLMSSVADTFHSVYTNATDLKELTPEFYTLPATFMVNSERLDFGTKQDGSPVDDVELPPWARDPIDFIHKMREVHGPYVHAGRTRVVSICLTPVESPEPLSSTPHQSRRMLGTYRR
jgi:factor associated with neutral sphingomyelinase activation